jgi:tetratricopeptide (TPR) repeat protein
MVTADDISQDGFPDGGAGSVAGFRAVAVRILASRTFGRESLERAAAALQKALKLDPEDATGETSALLGKVHFQMQAWDDAVRFLELAASKRPGEGALVELLDQARDNAKSGIGDPMIVGGLFERDKLLAPPATQLRPPDFAAPTHLDPRNLFHIGVAWRRVQALAGVLLGPGVSIAVRVVRLFGLHRGNRDAWRDRGWLFGLMTLAAVREDLNKRLRRDPYPAGELTAHQQAAQKRPAWTRRLPTANGSWRTDDPMEGAALSRFNRSGQCIEYFRSRMGDDLPNVLGVARDLMHIEPGKKQALAPFLNLSYVSHIQAQAHDWMSHGENLSNELWTVQLPADHPGRKQGIEYMRVPKTQPDPNPTNGWLTFVNENTHWWDASQVYGSDQATCDRLRTGSDDTLLPCGKLYLEDARGNPDLEHGFFRVNPRSGIVETGFTRNIWVGLAAEYLLLARHHNWVCEQLRRRYPDKRWTSDQLYGMARLIVAGMQAKIHTDEWTAAVLPNDKVVLGLNTNLYGLIETLLKPFGERRLCSPWVPKHPVLGGLVGGARDNHGVRHGFSEEFVSVYRLHEGLVDDLEIRGVGDPQPRERISLPATRGKAAGDLLRQYGLETILHSLGCQKGGALVGNSVPSWAVQMSIEGHSFIDVAAIDLLRDRERGIPGYNEARRLFGFPPLRSYDEMKVTPEVKEKFEKHYGAAPEGLERMDLQIGMLHDLNRPEGFAFDDLRFRVFIHAEASRFEQDPFFTEFFVPEVYTDWGIRHIEEMNRKKLILLHCPALERSGLQGVNNAFEPWTSTAASVPEEHPLTAKGIERYSPRASAPVDEAPPP